jgi:Domain of unknown function (DUF1707)/Domain of unknown function (DUF4190)
MSHDQPTPYLRASDADREACVDRLHRAAVEGRLDADELDERVAAAYASRWTSDLDHLTADVTPPPRLHVPAPYPPPQYPAPAVPRPQANGLAAAALIAGILWFGWLGSIAAVVFGHVALFQIKGSNGRQCGYGMAVTGLVLGYVALAVLALKLAVPGF